MTALTASRPPLELAVEVEAAGGKITRWDGSARSAGDVPTGISFGTKRGDGFSDGPQITLKRRIDRDYADINLYDKTRLVGADGSIAHEGYIAASPRSFDGGHSVGVRVAGPMTRAQRRPFDEVYIDRDLQANWMEWSARQHARMVISGGWNTEQFSWQQEASGDGLAGLAVTTQGTLNKWPLTEYWYRAPGSAKVGRFRAAVSNWLNYAADANVKLLAYSADSDLPGYNATTGLETGDQVVFPGSPPGSSGGIDWTLPTPRQFVFLQHEYASAGPAGTVGTTYGYQLASISVIGTHGLALIGSGAADGFAVSDIIADIARRFTTLDPSGVLPTSYPVSHAVFNATQPYDAWLQLNKYHLWELCVWEDNVLHYYPADVSDYDWQVRLDDPGVTVDVPGDSTENLANGIVVTYMDVATGMTTTITPADTPALADPNPLNPATLHGEEAWIPLDLSAYPLTAGDAAQIGAAKLAEANQATAAGTITFQGHIRDRAGNWQPGWKVRATDTIAIVNHPDDRPRLIHETTWDQDSLKGTIAVDNTLNRMDAYLDRLSLGLQAAGVGTFPTS